MTFAKERTEGQRHSFRIDFHFFSVVHKSVKSCRSTVDHVGMNLFGIFDEEYKTRHFSDRHDSV